MYSIHVLYLFSAVPYGYMPEKLLLRKVFYQSVCTRGKNRISHTETANCPHLHINHKPPTNPSFCFNKMLGIKYWFSLHNI